MPGEVAYCIQETTDGGYIVAASSGSSVNGNVSSVNHGNEDCWIIKLDALGNIIWNKLFGGNNNEAFYGICQTPDGGFIMAGYSNSTNNAMLPNPLMEVMIIGSSDWMQMAISFKINKR